MHFAVVQVLFKSCNLVLLSPEPMGVMAVHACRHDDVGSCCTSFAMLCVRSYAADFYPHTKVLACFAATRSVWHNFCAARQLAAGSLSLHTSCADLALTSPSNQQQDVSAGLYN
jgi:hypothetical protein